MRKKLFSVLAAVFFIAAVAALSYPIISNVLNNRESAVTVESYDTAVERLTKREKESMLKNAEKYNAALSPQDLDDSLNFSPENYDEMLSVTDDGAMCCINIPSLSMYLPVYHGTEVDTLQKGIGHLAGSALPVGGEGTHCVLTGHSGLAENKLFTDITKLEVGDIFYLHTLGETLAYKVGEINTVDPSDKSLLKAEDGEDLCTLVTCTPYGINTHRLLVKGERIDYVPPQDAVTEVPEETHSNFRFFETVCAVLGILFLIGGIAVLLSDKIRGRKVKHEYRHGKR